jgi:hypothetical protein
MPSDLLIELADSEAKPQSIMYGDGHCYEKTQLTYVDYMRKFWLQKKKWCQAQHYTKRQII